MQQDRTTTGRPKHDQTYTMAYKKKKLTEQENTKPGSYNTHTRPKNKDASSPFHKNYNAGNTDPRTNNTEDTHRNTNSGRKQARPANYMGNSRIREME